MSLQGSIERRVGIFILGAIAIFIYMGFHIGAFRFDKYRYGSYFAYFKDVSGLTRKAEVKIAGVKVGWVENLDLLENGKLRAKAELRVDKSYSLYMDAYAIVRQDGLLGTKYVEVVPGDPQVRQLIFGETLDRPGAEPVNIDKVLQRTQKIAKNVEEITQSFKEVVGGVRGEENLRSIFHNLEEAAKRFASFSQSMDSAIRRNDTNIDKFLEIGENFKIISERLDKKLLPSFQENVERISDVVDRDFNRVAGKISDTADAIGEASIQARDSLKHLGSVSEKIDEGRGLIGKLINEEEPYRDIRVAARGVKNYFSKIDQLQVVFDSHFETMQRPAENYRFEDSKGYFDIRLHPNDDYFYIIQLVTSQKGYLKRAELHKSYKDKRGNEVCPRQYDLSDRDKFRFIFTEKFDFLDRNAVRLGFQFGKVFGPIACRLGLLDGFFGGGVDFDIPLKNENFRWVTSIEGFDFTGFNRIEDRRPHLKWLNRVFILRNIYLTFGADDFISRRNGNIFFGFGIRFGDDNIKYLLSTLGGSSAALGSSSLGGNLNTAVLM